MTRNVQLPGAPSGIVVVGTEFENTYSGTTRDDDFKTFGGNDQVYGNSGNDTIDGGGGEDSLYGGAGDDVILGGAGNDLIVAGGGTDKLTGGSGSDLFIYEGGVVEITDFATIDKIGLSDTFSVEIVFPIEDRISSVNGGQDTLIDFGNGNTLLLRNTTPADLENETFQLDAIRSRVDASPAPMVDETGGDGTPDDGPGDSSGDGPSAGDPTPDDPPAEGGGSGVENKTYYGSTDADEFNAGVGDDVLFGSVGDDILLGNAGNDRLFGGDDQDVLDGGTGDDKLDGGDGDDVLTGGQGADSFDFYDGNDIITDFEVGTDVINLSPAFIVREFFQVVERMFSANNGTDTFLRFSDDDTLLIQGVNVNDLDGSSFGFHPQSPRWEDGNEPSQPPSIDLDNPTLDAGGSTGGPPRLDGETDAQKVIGAPLRGTEASEELKGGQASELIAGGSGNDILDGGEGDDTLDGGEGDADIARFKGSITDYMLQIGPDGVMIRGPETGTDTLIDVEMLSFESGAWFARNGMLNLKDLTGIASLTQDELSTFVEMYIAYFDRAPDAMGLLYWGTRLADGMGLEEIAESFFAQPESKRAFPNSEDAATLVDTAYRNLLERAPDEEGRDYWINALNTGDQTPAKFMLALINGAKANPDSEADVRTITEKAELGLYYAVTNGLSNVPIAEAAMALYDPLNAADSLASARSLIDGFAAEASDGDGVGDELVIPLVGIYDDAFGLG